jgi:DnaJ-class molecular chaperone
MLVMAFSPSQTPCVHCRGRGTVLISERTWQTCQHCLGTGRTLTPEQLQRFHVATGRFMLSRPEED